jgi:predicted Zn-dependent protease
MQRTAGGGASFDPQQFFKSSASLTRLMSRPFRPQDESTADRDGATWAHKAGYDSRELAGLLYKMHDRDKQRTVPLPSFFRTHPYHQDRYDALLKVADELQESDPRDPLYRGKTNLQQRIARSQKEFPE